MRKCAASTWLIPTNFGALVSAVAFSTLALGCVKKDDLIVWTAEAPSPDGKWLASADTLQNGGFGSADIYTTVHLTPARGTPAPIDVIGIDSQGPMPHPYVLDNAANKGGSIDLTMTWVTPTQLRITYADQPCTVVNLQVVKYAGIDVILQAVGQHHPC
jgi:hypothetical protein